MLIIRAAATAMRDPRQQHGEPLFSPAAFRDALEKNRLALACVTPDEAAKSHRENKFAKELGRHAPVYQAGEVVIMREPRNDGNTAGRVHKLDQTKAEDYLRCLALDKSRLQGIEANPSFTARSALRPPEPWSRRAAVFTNSKCGLCAAPNSAHGTYSAQPAANKTVAAPMTITCKSKSVTAPNPTPSVTAQTRNIAAKCRTRRDTKAAQEKKRDRENDVRAIMEQQDRGGRG